MTNDEIDIIAAKAQGWTFREETASSPTGSANCIRHPATGKMLHPYPYYSTDYNAAHELLAVVEREKRWHEFTFALLKMTGEAQDMRLPAYFRIALSATPRQLVEAALKALGIEEGGS